jgi:hypothetical protein
VASRTQADTTYFQSQLIHALPKAQIQIWAMDEHRLGLKSVQRRVWTQRREQLIAAVKKRFQWLWLYGDKS